VELCEGLVEIGEGSFSWCNQSITKINIPISLRRINDWAFIGSLRTPIHLHDDIESIGIGAFARCIFTNFRVPSLITLIPGRMLFGCLSIFSLELPQNLMKIHNYAFFSCSCLRNLAFPPDAVFGRSIVGNMTDLQRLFGSELEIIRELQHRFDGLPIHRLMYYLSYNHGVLQNLIAVINMRSGHMDPIGNQQDSLGMTPLHILACSLFTIWRCIA
jgi:hypothetical protein